MMIIYKKQPIIRPDYILIVIWFFRAKILSRTDTFDVVVEKTEEKSNEDSTFAAESDNADESAETTPNDDTSDREIQCAACGNISKQRNWFLSRIGTHYVICPKCGTLRYVCHNNAGYRKE